MKDLRTLLEETGVRTSVVIDDVFDIVPRPDDLDDADWSTFFDDLGENSNVILRQAYGGYEESDVEDLKISQDFISSVWKIQEELPITSRDALFGNYKITNDAERRRLDGIIVALEDLGLRCIRMGRDLIPEATQTDLINVDLFLGFHQNEDDIERSVRRVKELVQDRQQSPPLVVLTSSSTRLQEKSVKFRDDAGLLGSTFRVVRKTDLAVPRTLKMILTRLVTHYNDAKRVAKFISAWDTSLNDAREHFIKYFAGLICTTWLKYVLCCWLS